MSDVIAIRVPKKLKKELEELKIDYAVETRAFLETIVKREKLKKFIKEIDEHRVKLAKEAGLTQSSADIIRWDRDHGH